MKLILIIVFFQLQASAQNCQHDANHFRCVEYRATMTQMLPLLI